jgi:hypothetical protein
MKVTPMWKNEAKTNLTLFIKAGLPFTIGGMAVVFGGLYGLKQYFAGSDYLTPILFGWLALFWFIYQPLFKNRILRVKNAMEKG